MPDISRLESLARLARYWSLVSTTKAGSGHPTSSMSAADLMVGLMFGGMFRFDLEDPAHPNNDRLIFSKGHASPLFYALYALAGKVSEDELMQLRTLESRLEGHPTPEFEFTEAATGSLGQGLSVGVGMALAARMDGLPYRTYVLLGDSETAEGAVWEAIHHAGHEKLDNLVAIIDVNRLGQRGETMEGHDTSAYVARLEAFGWEVMEIDGHDMSQVLSAFARATEDGRARPLAVVARTLKGKGVASLEDKDGWHGKPVPKEDLPAALAELGEVDTSLRGDIPAPEDLRPSPAVATAPPAPSYPSGTPIATRKAYGRALERLAPAMPDIVAVDAEVSNSTYAEGMKKVAPERFLEMYIAEQHMAGVALGLSKRGKRPLASSFAAFLTRAFDQIRMAAYSAGNVLFVGSHAGVSIGQDGASQMGLEDLAMFRTVSGSTVLYPSDPYACERLVEAALARHGVTYLRTTRMDTPVLYGPDDAFPVGGSKTLRSSAEDKVAIVAAGVTLHEALAAYDELGRNGIIARVIDLYSVKPLDDETLRKAARETGVIVVVEDHVPEGGLADAVRAALADESARVSSLAVTKVPHSATPEELLELEGIDARAIVTHVTGLL